MRPFSTKPNNPKAKILQKHMALTHVKVEKGSFSKRPKTAKILDHITACNALQIFSFFLLSVLFIVSTVVFRQNFIAHSEKPEPKDPHALYDQIMRENNPVLYAQMLRAEKTGERVPPRLHVGINGERIWARFKRHLEKRFGKHFPMSQDLNKLQ